MAISLTYIQVGRGADYKPGLSSYNEHQGLSPRYQEVPHRWTNADVGEYVAHFNCEDLWNPLSNPQLEKTDVILR